MQKQQTSATVEISLPNGSIARVTRHEADTYRRLKRQVELNPSDAKAGYRFETIAHTLQAIAWAAQHNAVICGKHSEKSPNTLTVVCG